MSCEGENDIVCRDFWCFGVHGAAESDSVCRGGKGEDGRLGEGEHDLLRQEPGHEGEEEREGRDGRLGEGEHDLLRREAGREGEGEREGNCRDGRLGEGEHDLLRREAGREGEGDNDIVCRGTWCFGVHGVAESDSVRRGAHFGEEEYDLLWRDVIVLQPPSNTTPSLSRSSSKTTPPAFCGKRTALGFLSNTSS